MNITDVPQSGIYYQQGAIVQLVVQLIDITTGDPVNLQTATGLVISVLYPDRSISQSFVASLYTDGSDGRITYTTKNDGVTVDLSQVGLYQIQGSAVVGDVALPPSYESDFYVLRNTFGGITVPITTASGLVMLDIGSVRYVGTVDPSGDLTFAQQNSGPPSFVYFNTLVMKDSDGVYWTVAMGTDGVYVATPGGSFANALNYILMNDINGKTWVITISTQGVLTPA